MCGAGDATWGPSGGDGFAAVCVVVVVVGKHTARGQDRQEGGGWGFFFRLYGEQVGPGCLWRGSRRSFGEGGEDGWMDGRMEEERYGAVWEGYLKNILKDEL